MELGGCGERGLGDGWIEVREQRYGKGWLSSWVGKR